MGNNNELPELLLPPPEIKPKGCCDKFSLFIASGKADPSDITCSICFRIFANPRIMKCKHKYCQECITTWGKGPTASCPFCRLDLKRQRGTFGRIDKQTQKKIDKLNLKCRNCCWEDDGELPVDKSDCHEDEPCVNQIKQEKEENIDFERTTTKLKEQDCIKEQVCKKQEKKIDQKEAKKAFELFASTFLTLVQSGQLNWDFFA